MSLNNFDYAPEALRSSDEDRLLMENGEDDLDVPKELSIDNIRGMRASIEKNVKDLEEALAEVTTSQEENSEELVNELNLALEQSNLLLEKIVIIEDGYKKAIKTDTLLSKDIIDLSEQLGFIVPLHLTTTIEEISENVSNLETPNTQIHNEVTQDSGLEVREGDYKFVSFDELEKYLNEPLLPEEKSNSPKDDTPQRVAARTTSIPSTPQDSPNQTNQIKSPLSYTESEPVTPNTSKEMRKEYLKNSINMSKVSFSSPTSTASFFSTPAVEKSDRKNLDAEDYIELTPIVEDENPALTEEQQQLIEEQDVNNLLEQLMIYTNGLEEAKNSPRNRPLGDLISKDKDEDTPHENVSSPSIFMRQENASSPIYTRVTPRDIPKEAPREISRVVESPPKLSSVNLENEFMKRDLEDAKHQINQLKQQVEFLQSKVISTDAENVELKQTVELLHQSRNQFDSEIQSIKEKEEKINLIASSLGDHIEFLQSMVDKLKNERDSKVIKQSEQLTTIIETLIKKENTLLQTVVEQMESEMSNRKVVLDEEMLKLKKLVLECLGEEENSKEMSSESLQTLQSELQTVADELSEINYFPSDPDDDIDIAVTRTLESLECPVTIEIERIGYGEYYLDRKLYVKLGPKGEALVKNGNSFITLISYVKRLYAPFFTTEKHLKEEEQQEIEAQALQSSKFESLLQKLSKTRDYINNLHTGSGGPVSRSPPASPPRRSSPLKNNTTLNLSHLNNSNESTSPTKLSPREGPRLPQKKESQDDQGKEGRPSSAPPNTRYINILQRAEKNKKLKPIKPTPQVRRPPPNSMTFDRRNSPLPPNYVMHNNNLLFVKQPSNYEQVLAAHQSVKKPTPVTQKPASTNNSRPSSPRNQPNQQGSSGANNNMKSTLFGSVDLSDPKQLEKLKKQALRMQIQQFSQKPIH